MHLVSAFTGRNTLIFMSNMRRALKTADLKNLARKGPTHPEERQFL
jgi:hypothetical protein